MLTNVTQLSADAKWRAGLQKVFSELRGERALFLVDVKPRDGSPKEGDGSYKVDHVVKFIKTSLTSAEVRIVSSYASGPLEWKIWPKSPETLRAIEVDLASFADLYPVGKADALDVLVTGAGFELREEHRWEGRRGPQEVYFGLPRTGEILWNMRSPFHDEIVLNRASGNKKSKKIAESEFPWPANRGFSGAGPTQSRGIAGIRSNEGGIEPSRGAFRLHRNRLWQFLE